MIAAALDRHGQRAPYGAVAGLVVALPLTVMKGLPKCPRNSWVVTASTGKPSGYAAQEISPRLKTNDKMIRTPEELAAWLENHW